MDDSLLLQKYKRLILFGVDTPRPENHTVALVLMNATQHHLMERRNNNTRTDIPLNHDTSATIRKIFRHTCTIAKGLLRNAEKEESRIYRTFNKWVPDKTPVEECKELWGHFINWDNPHKLQLPYKNIPNHSDFNPPLTTEVKNRLKNRLVNCGSRLC